MYRIFLILLLSGFCIGAFLKSSVAQSPGDGTLVFRSGAERTALLELYTSQGCSSCPPAEAWIRTLARDPNLWKTIVPVSFHVDYWDRLGWKDPYSSPGFTQRQYEYAHELGQASVYTPCVILDGHEWRGWYSDEKPTATKSIGGILEARLDKNAICVSYSDKNTSTALHVAILGFGIETAIARGENANKKLTQDFIVLKHEILRAARGEWTSGILGQTVPHATRYALAVWVNRPGIVAPLQATGGWLPAEVMKIPG